MIPDLTLGELAQAVRACADAGTECDSLILEFQTRYSEWAEERGLDPLYPSGTYDDKTALALRFLDQERDNRLMGRGLKRDYGRVDSKPFRQALGRFPSTDADQVELEKFLARLSPYHPDPVGEPVHPAALYTPLEEEFPQPEEPYSFSPLDEDGVTAHPGTVDIHEDAVGCGIDIHDLNPRHVDIHAPLRRRSPMTGRR